MTFVKGHTPWHKGRTGVYSRRRLEEMSRLRKGRVAWNKGLTKKTDPRLIKGHNYVRKICSNCGKEFYRYPSLAGIYCSKACFYIGRKKIKNITCLNCGKNFQAARPSWSPKFCSRYCHGQFISKYRSGSKSAAWRGGISFQPYPPDFQKQLKELIRYRDGYKCQICSCSEIENMAKLSIHHINYNKNDCNPENLISLCRRCHSITNRDRDEWQKFFSKKINKIMSSSPIQLSFKIQNHKIKEKII